MTTPDLPVFPAHAWLIRAATAAGMTPAEVRRLSADGRALSAAMGRLPKPERAELSIDLSGLAEAPRRKR